MLAVVASLTFVLAQPQPIVFPAPAGHPEQIANSQDFPFIPPLPGWEARSPFIRREGRVSFYHYDFYAQALAKIERGHARDRADVEMLLARGLVKREALLAQFDAIAPELYRYPAIDATSFRKRVEDAAGDS